MKILIKILQKQLLLVYIVLSLLIYFATDGAGMIFDFNGWTSHYINGSYRDVLNSFGYQGLHQMEQFAFFSIFKLVRFNTFAWYFIFAFLHGLVAWVSYLFIYKWLRYCSINKAYNIAILASFLFLISPFASDTVVSKVTIHYLMSNLFMYSALYFLIVFHEKEQYKHLIFVLFLFVLSLFSLEISYIFPLLYSIVWFSLFYFRKEFKISKKLIVPIVFPIIIFIGFLYLHKIMIGSVIGHYGTEVHLSFNFSEIFSTVVRYFASYTVFFDYWDFKYKTFASEILESYSVIFFILMLLIFTSITYTSVKNNKKECLIILIVFVLAVISLAPVSNLYYAYMFPIENDRYSYLMSLFFYVFIVLIFFEIKKVKLRNAIIIIFTLLNSYFLISNIIVFNKSSKLTWSLLNDFRWFEDEVIILMHPDNVAGAKMFSTLTDTTAFSESLMLHTGIDRRANIKSIYEMNYVNLNDSVIVTKVDNYNYKVQLAQWGNWYWKRMIGATSFENDWARADVVKKGMNYYNLQIKDTNTNFVFIYAAGDKWREVK